MREGWIETTLGEVATRMIGRTPSRKEPRYWTHDLSHPFFTIADMTSRNVTTGREGITESAIEERQAKRVPAGSLLLSFKLSIGKVAITDRDVYPNEAIAWIAPKDCVSQDFLALALENVQWDELGGRAVKGRTMNKASLDAVRLVVPPLEEQRRIVDLIDAIDSVLAAGTSVSEQLNRVLKRLRDRIPEGVMVPLGEVLTSIESGVSTKPVDAPGDRVNLLSLASLRPGVFRAEQVKDVGAATLPERARLREGDLLITRSNTPDRVGYVAKARDVIENTFIPDLVWRLVVDESQVSSSYLEQLLSSPTLRTTITAAASGTSQSMRKINKRNFSAIRIPLPSRGTQDDYVAPLLALSETARRYEKLDDQLNRLRSNLLSVLLSGEHEIPDSYDAMMRELTPVGV